MLAEDREPASSSASIAPARRDVEPPEATEVVATGIEMLQPVEE